jgi:hypothetical protein
MIPPFRGSTLKIAHAHTHLVALMTYVQGVAERLEVRTEPVPGPNPSYRYVFSEDPTENIALGIGDVAHNLRSALDILICDIARVRGQDIGKLLFPFAKDAASLENRFNQIGLPRLGDDLLDAIRALRPYREGGNADLTRLHELDINDKHQLIIPVVSAAAAAVNMGRIIGESLKQRYDIDMHIMQGGPRDITLVHHGETVITSADGDPNGLFEIIKGDIRVHFKGGPFAAQPVVPALRETGKVVLGVVRKFEAQFA